MMSIGSRFANAISHAASNGEFEKLQDILTSLSSEDKKYGIIDSLLLDEYQLPTGINKLAYKHAIEICLIQSISKFPILHNCVSQFPLPSFQWPKISNKTLLDEKTGNFTNPLLASKRVDIALCLLRFPRPIINLKSLDSDGRTVIHAAIKYLDSDLFTEITALYASDSSKHCEFEAAANIPCRIKGWTALHYAADAANIDAIRQLVAMGVNMVTKSSKQNKQLTALEIVKNRLHNSTQLSTEYVSVLQAIAKELSEAIRYQEKLNRQSAGPYQHITGSRPIYTFDGRNTDDSDDSDDSDDTNGGDEIYDSDNRIETKFSNVFETEHDVKDSLEGIVSSLEIPVISPSDATKYEEKRVAELHLENSVLLSSESNTPQRTHPGKFKNEPKSLESMKDIISEENTATNAIIIDSSCRLQVDMVSRDDLIECLLGMGFIESDCLLAVTACGRNLDAAIAWLCERPTISPSINLTSTRSVSGTSSTLAEKHSKKKNEPKQMGKKSVQFQSGKISTTSVAAVSNSAQLQGGKVTLSAENKSKKVSDFCLIKPSTLHDEFLIGNNKFLGR